MDSGFKSFDVEMRQYHFSLCLPLLALNQKRAVLQVYINPCPDE